MSLSCRSEEGITVGLIDSVIYMCRVLKDRDVTHPEIQEALKDLGQDEDFHQLVEHINKAIEKL